MSRLVQITGGCSPGDAISTEILLFEKILKNSAWNDVFDDFSVYAEFTSPAFAGTVKNLKDLKTNPDDVVLLHYSISLKNLDVVLKLNNTKFVLYHNITPSDYFRPYSTMIAGRLAKARNELRLLTGRFDGYFADSSFNARELEYYCRNPISVWPVLFQFPHIKKNKPELTGADALKLLSVGRIAPNKGHADLIKILHYLRKLSPDCSLTLAGGIAPELTGYRGELERLAQSLNVASAFDCTGFLDDDDLQRKYANSSAYVCASRHEGFCVPLLEAMAYDLPVFALNSPGSAVAETMGESGVLFHEMDHARAAEVIFYLCTNSNIHEAVLEGQRKRLAQYDPEKAAFAAFQRMKELIVEKGRNYV